METTDLMASILRTRRPKGVWMRAFAAHTRHQIDDVLEDLWRVPDDCQTSYCVERLETLHRELAGAVMLM